jgi:hypothetical protein
VNSLLPHLKISSAAANFLQTYLENGVLLQIMRTRETLFIVKITIFFAV